MTKPGYGIQCPKCGREDSRVIDTRPRDGAIYRRRVCSCGHRFSSAELQFENSTLRKIDKVRKLLDLFLND